VILAVGGAAGGLGRFVATRMGLPCTVPADAEIISSIGDALSLLRAERERTATASAEVIDAMMAEVEDEVINAGASPGSVEVRLEEVAERSTIRAVATGAIGLSSGALPGRGDVDETAVREAAPPGARVVRCGRFWVTDANGHIAVLDRFGDVVTEILGEIVEELELGAAVERLTRYRGPILLKPSVWIVDDRRLLELAAFDPSSNPYRGRTGLTYLVGRSV
jgi:hypothetical protein